MINPFDDHGDDETGREIRAEIARLEEEKRERERLAQEQLEAEQAAAHSSIEESDAEFVTVEEEARLELGDGEERLPWLESDDDYADDTVDTGRIATVALLGLLAILSIVGLAWWLGRDKPDTELLAEGSTIEAPAEPFRSRPANPGGAAAEGTGDVSYEVGEGQDRPSRVASATPTATPTPAASASATAAARPSIDRNQTAAAAPATAGGIGVQVGAYSSRATAETGWSQLQGQHSALSGVSHRVVQAEVDGNTVFRLQAVAGNAAAADTLCRAIKSGGGDCRVVN